MVDLYVYYKVPDPHAPRLEPLVRTMQARLAERHGVAVQLKRRPGSKDGLQTWMEVYPAVHDAFASLLDAAAHEAGLAQFVHGPRRTEVFTDLTPCA
jgi:hypothetical protein